MPAGLSRSLVGALVLLVLSGSVASGQNVPVIKLTRHEEAIPDAPKTAPTPTLPPKLPKALILTPKTEEPPPAPPRFDPPARPIPAAPSPPAHLTLPPRAGPASLAYPQPIPEPIQPAAPPPAPPSSWGDDVCVWMRAEAMLWWVRSQPLPSLVTSSLPGTPQGLAGVLGASGTGVVVGNQGANRDPRFGARLAAGVWFDEGQVCGLTADYFFLQDDRTTRTVTFDGAAPLARPFFDTVLGRNSSQLVGFPGLLTGRILVGTNASAIEGAGALLRENLLAAADGSGNVFCRVAILVGYRYLRLAESLDVTENLITTNTGAEFAVGTQVVARDIFQTRNIFHGADIGLASEYHQGAFSFEMTAKVAAGYMAQRVRILGGKSVTTPDGLRADSAGGLLALSSNIGTYRRSNATVIPELGLNAGWQLNPYVRVYAGYNLVFVGDAVRPGDHVDLGVNPNLLPPPLAGGPDRPTFAFHSSDLWLQGAKVGVEFNY